MFDHLKNQLLGALYCAAALIGRFFTSAYRKATAALSEATALCLNAPATVALRATRPWMPQRRVYCRERSSSSDDDEAHLLAA